MKLLITIFISCLMLLEQSSCNLGKSTEKDLSADTSLSLITREWSKKIHEYPENAEYRYQRALSLQKDRRYSLAIEDIDKAIILSKGKTDYKLLKGDLLFASGKTKEALDVFKTASQKDPKNTDALFKTAQFQLFVKEYPMAINNFKKLITLDNSRPDAYFFMGMAYKEMNDTLQAINNFINTITVDPENYNAYMQLGIIYSEKADSSGLAYFSNAIRVDEFSDEAFYARGFLLQKLKRYREAVKDYNKTISLNPSHTFAYYNAANINATEGFYDAAIQQLKTAVKFDPDFDKAYNRLGQLYELTGNKEKAIENYRKCLQITPDFTLAIEGMERLNANNGK